MDSAYRIRAHSRESELESHVGMGEEPVRTRQCATNDKNLEMGKHPHDTHDGFQQWYMSIVYDTHIGVGMLAHCEIPRRMCRQVDAAVRTR